jgi:DNA-binding response OmpR family regulator
VGGVEAFSGLPRSGLLYDYDIILLDLNLPDMSGPEPLVMVCKSEFS